MASSIKRSCNKGTQDDEGNVMNIPHIGYKILIIFIRQQGGVQQKVKEVKDHIDAEAYNNPILPAAFLCGAAGTHSPKKVPDAIEQKQTRFGCKKAAAEHIGINKGFEKGKINHEASQKY